MEAKVYDKNAKAVSSVSLPENLFGLHWNSDLVHQVATSLESSKRKAIAHTKDRSEVRGGGKKPWQQKGTGRARHGSTRSPIWVGGGITHGPRNEKNFERKISKKMKAKAFFTLLSRKFKDGEVLFVDSIGMTEPKTKNAIALMKGFAGIKGFETLVSKRNNSAIVALSTKNKDVERAMGNLGNFEVVETRNLHPLALLKYKYVVIENPSVSIDLLPGKNYFGGPARLASESVAGREKKAPTTPKASKSKAKKVTASKK